MKAKEESEKNGLKLNIQKNEDNGIWSHQFIANTWGKMKTVLDFIVLGSKISADGDCSHEVKRHLLLESKAMTNLDSVLKSRDISLPTKVRIILWFIQYSCNDVTVGPRRRLNAKELMLLNCGAIEDSWESLGQ